MLLRPSEGEKLSLVHSVNSIVWSILKPAEQMNGLGTSLGTDGAQVSIVT